ncbi:MAG: hypothetical protein KGZ25_01450, partial [Planctomycetes bacterium]|nr:hypothetical protein [Planctomycetota bacterium]
FDSEVHVVFEGDKYDCEDVTDLNEVGIEPTSDVGFDVEGRDANKASEILEMLVKYRFYIEEAMGAEANQKGG